MPMTTDALPGSSVAPPMPGPTETAIYNTKMQHLIQQLLVQLGEDPTREGW